MAPPLISEYKINFVLKRLVETFFGGLKLFSPPLFILVQILLYIFPALIVSLVNLRNAASDLDSGLGWKSVVTFFSIFLFDLFLSLVIFLLKKGRTASSQIVPAVRVTSGSLSGDSGIERGDGDNNTDHRFHHSNQIHEHVSSFLSQEDMVPNEGCHKPSTWLYIAPNPSISLDCLNALLISSLSFGLCTPLLISEGIHPVIRGFAIFALCNARYSSLINAPSELATFDITSPERKNILYRPFYTALVGLAYQIFAQFSQEPAQYGHCVLTSLASILSSLPLLWGFGMLPPLDAFFPWTFGTLLLLLGGTSPSYYYGGTLISLAFVCACPILVFIISQEPLIIVLAECICGYFIACDTGRIVTLQSALCQDTPTKSLLKQVLYPIVSISISLLFVYLSWLNFDGEPVDTTFPYEVTLASLCLSVSVCALLFRHFTMSQEKELRKGILGPIHVAFGLLPFFLHAWLTLSIEHERVGWSSLNEMPEILGQESSNDNNNTTTNDTISSRDITAVSHSLLRIVPYILTIRGFCLAVLEPMKSSLDLTLSFLVRLHMGKANCSFVLILFLCSLATSRVRRCLKLCKTMLSIWYAFAISTLMDGKKAKLLVLSAILSPLSLFSLLLVTIVEGMTLIPLFTLPIFLPSFPRPSTFWAESWIAKRSRKGGGNDVETLDCKIYSEIGPLISSALGRKAQMTKFKLERGDKFLARYEDRLIMIKVTSTAWNCGYFQIKGLEMQEQTSCHHQEAAKVDEIFDAVLSPLRSNCSKCSVDFLSLLNLNPLCSLKLPTYSESKSKISNLSSQEEISTFKDMFYRAFTYLWIKNNPALKGELYQKGIVNRSRNVSGPVGQLMTKGNNKDDVDENNATAATGKHDFSVKNALAKATKSTLTFLSRVNSIEGPSSASKNPEVSEPTSKESSPDNIDQQDEDSYHRQAIRRQSSILSRQSTRSNLISPTGHGGNGNRKFSVPAPPPTSTRLIDVESEALLHTPSNSSNEGNGYERLSTIWVKQCVGDVIPSNAVKARVEKICKGVWDTILGLEELDIDLSDFFQDEFLLKLKRLSTSPRVDMELITLKALRYASKLALDEIFSTINYSTRVVTIDAEMEEDIFSKLTLYERDYQFCSPSEISFWIQQNCNHIVTLGKVEDKGRCLVRMFNYEPEGVEFRVGQLDSLTVEGIWGNLNLEMLYLTSDDDERLSIQNDRVLLRNILTQCAKSPLGYPVWEGLFRVNLHNFSVKQIE